MNYIRAIINPNIFDVSHDAIRNLTLIALIDFWCNQWALWLLYLLRLAGKKRQQKKNY